MDHKSAILELTNIQSSCSNDTLYQAIDAAVDALTKIGKLNSMFEGSVNHFDYTDAMDLVYDAKSVLRV